MGSKYGGGVIWGFEVFFHFWTLLGPTLLLECSRTSIFHHFGVAWTLKTCSCHHAKPKSTRNSFCFLSTVHGGAQIVPEKNRESFPLSKDVVWCCLRMLLLAVDLGVLKSAWPRYQKMNQSQMELHRAVNWTLTKHWLFVGSIWRQKPGPWGSNKSWTFSGIHFEHKTTLKIGPNKKINCFRIYLGPKTQIKSLAFFLIIVLAKWLLTSSAETQPQSGLRSP